MGQIKKYTCHNNVQSILKFQGKAKFNKVQIAELFCDFEAAILIKQLSYVVLERRKKMLINNIALFVFGMLKIARAAPVVTFM